MNDTMDAQVKRRNLCNCPNCQTDDCPAGVELAECREQLRLANEDALRLYNAFSYFRVPDDVDKNTGAAIRAHEARVRGEMKHDKTLR